MMSALKCVAVPRSDFTALNPPPQMTLVSKFSSSPPSYSIPLSSTAQTYNTSPRNGRGTLNVTDIAHHKYQVLEECLFYKLTKDADQMQGKSNALMLLPPTVAAGETLDVQVLHAAVRQMWMNEVFKEMNINGYLKLVRFRLSLKYL
uniref:NR LBD domain-containing protein n=1 Tax=Angiostrongylus cantonensis TaxID=6313 RepID=A0A0K0DFS8_ANGCA